VRTAFTRVVIVTVLAVLCAPHVGVAQSTPSDTTPDQRFADAMDDPESSETESDSTARISWLRVMYQGGPLMIPILGMSLVVVAVAIERLWALRSNRVLPRELVQELGEMALEPGAFDPKAAYRVCQNSPSAAATVVRAMLLKAGRPLPEIEHAAAQASQREAARLYRPVRTIQLATAVCPLLGLLGTVQGMIQAFFVTANMPAGADRLDLLADGIYIALATTFAGLCVAIPSSLVAHYFEGVIQRQFLRIEELTTTLEPHLERFEGRLKREPKRPEERSSGKSSESSRAPTAAPML
jgi:biopolymer transport protein ExbB